MIITEDDIASFRVVLHQCESDTRWQRLLQKAMAEHGLDNAETVARSVIGQLDENDLRSFGNGMEPLDIQSPSLDDVRSRLWANRDFPLVMFATSGQFTAGVVRRKGSLKTFFGSS